MVAVEVEGLWNTAGRGWGLGFLKWTNFPLSFLFFSQAAVKRINKEIQPDGQMPLVRVVHQFPTGNCFFLEPLAFNFSLKEHNLPPLYCFLALPLRTAGRAADQIKVLLSLQFGGGSNFVISKTLRHAFMHPDFYSLFEYWESNLVGLCSPCSSKSQAKACLLSLWTSP